MKRSYLAHLGRSRPPGEAQGVSKVSLSLPGARAEGTPCAGHRSVKPHGRSDLENTVNSVKLYLSQARSPGFPYSSSACDIYMPVRPAWQRLSTVSP